MNASDQNRKKPTLAIVGEFSAGKSTLVNLLLGEKLSPTKVTATQVPPVIYSAGEPTVTATMQSGEEEALPLSAWEGFLPPETEVIRIGSPAPVLRDFSIIDLPGSSDPNQSIDAWEGHLSTADAVVWCTPATQAWRQSEKALWEQISSKLQDASVLLVTKIDMLGTEQDQKRVLKRLHRETGDAFGALVAMDLTAHATSSAQSDPGLSIPLERLHIVLRKALGLPTQEGAQQDAKAVVRAFPKDQATKSPADKDPADRLTERRIIPRRVVRTGRPARAAVRPPAP